VKGCLRKLNAYSKLTLDQIHTTSAHLSARQSADRQITSVSVQDYVSQIKRKERKKKKREKEKKKKKKRGSDRSKL